MKRALLPFLSVLAFLLCLPGCADKPATQPSEAPASVEVPNAPTEVLGPYAFPGAPLPGGAAPSVVAEPSVAPDIRLGDYPLSTERPPVVDGDTIRVTGLDNTLRLVGIDTEETFKDKGKKALAERDWNEYLKTIYAGERANRPPKFGSPFGEAGKDFAQRFFGGVETVRLEYDAPTRKRGYFGRHLVHVLANKDGRWVNFNVEVVRQGLSPYFVKYGRCLRYHDAFIAAEKEAREGGLGLWARAPPYPCYPDYPVRLVWWNDRDRDIEAVRAMKRAGQAVYLLGEDDDWKALGEQAGRSVLVAGVPGRLVRRGSLGLQSVAHRNRSDFMVVGPYEKMVELGLEKHSGDMMLLKGKISLYKKRPQFKLEDLQDMRPVGRE